MYFKKHTLHTCYIKLNEVQQKSEIDDEDKIEKCVEVVPKLDCVPLSEQESLKERVAQ